MIPVAVLSQLYAHRCQSVFCCALASTIRTLTLGTPRAMLPTMPTPDTTPTSPPLTPAAQECFTAAKAVDTLRDAAARAYTDLSLARDSRDMARMAAAMGSAMLRLADGLRRTADADRQTNPDREWSVKVGS